MKQPRAYCPRTWDLLEDRVVLSPGGTGPAVVASVQGLAATTPTQRLDSVAVAAHAAAVAAADSGGASNIVFFGDSITARFDEPGFPGLPVWNTEIAPLGAADFGVDGDRTQNLLWRLQNGELDGRPKVAVVEIGTNNLIYLNENESPQETVAGIVAVVQTIQSVSPGTKVLLLGILPRSESPSDPVRGEIEQVNNIISGLANGTSVRYLDLASLFLRPDGTIPPELMLAPDYLHLNTGGYQLLADALRAPLAAMLGQAAPDPATYGGPVLVDMPGDQVEEAAGSSGALLAFPLPLAFDALDPSPVVTSNPPRGIVLPLGRALVTCTATDRYGHSVSASFTVTVTPDIPPILHDIPSDLNVEATSALGAVVHFPMPTATDPSTSQVIVLCVPPSGSTFPVGVTLVTCTATDQAGNLARATFRIIVRDTTPPAIVAPDMVVEATGPGGAIVTYTQLHVADLVDPAPVVELSPASGTNLPLGNTLVTCTAMDRSGNVASSTFLVTVQDTPILNNPPHALVVLATGASGAVVKFGPPTVSDAADPGLRVAVSRPSGSRFPIGTTVVTCTATGLSGVTSTTAFTITVVPHRIVASVTTLAQRFLTSAAAMLGVAVPAGSSRSWRTTSLGYRPTAPLQGAAAAPPGLIAFLTRLDTNHDSQVSLAETTTFLSANVDLNHDGKISLYEAALFALADPADSALLFPSG